jgi:regulatory protein
MPGRPPPRPTEAWVLAIARHYLEQRGATEAWFRRWLGRRVGAAVRHHGSDAAEAAAWIDATVARMRGAGLLDDAEWAASRARSLRRRGASERAVRSALSQKGVRSELSAEVLAQEPPDADLVAARAWARRSRLGPWRRGPADPESRQRELARLARRGFSYEVARRVIDGPAEEG